MKYVKRVKHFASVSWYLEADYGVNDGEWGSLLKSAKFKLWRSISKNIKTIRKTALEPCQHCF